MVSEKSRTEEAAALVYLPQEEFCWALRVLGLGARAEQSDTWESARWDAVYQMLFEVFLSKRLAEMLGTGAAALDKGLAGPTQMDARESLREAARTLPQRQGLVFHFDLTLRRVGLQLKEIGVAHVRVDTY